MLVKSLDLQGCYTTPLSSQNRVAALGSDSFTSRAVATFIFLPAVSIN